MTDPELNPQYLIHSDQEPLRLECQARVYGVEDDLRHLALHAGDRVLDAGCGAGTISRSIARAVPRGDVVGLDREPRYLDFARRQAAAEGLSNLRFETGDLLNLPFEDHCFDLAWSKHVLQWVPERERALAELCRVTRPGGRVVCCNFDRFALAHWPINAPLQAELEQWFGAAQRELGFDNDLGRKLPSMFRAAGLTNLRVDFIPDRSFCGFGGDAERRWNWETQFNSVMPFTTRVFGGEQAARDFTARALQLLNDPEVFVYCTLFYVAGTAQ